MTDTVRLYVGRREANDDTCPYYLSDDEGMEEGCYVTLPKHEADDYSRVAGEYEAWQRRLAPMYDKARARVEADRDERKERTELSRLQNKYGRK